MKKSWFPALIGAITGFVNGMFGAGGGSILVPAMEKFLDTETHKAHATAIGVILPLSVVSALIYLWGVRAPWDIVLYVSAGGVIGGFVGARMLNKLASGLLHKIFGAFIIAAAIKMIVG